MFKLFYNRLPLYLYALLSVLMITQLSYSQISDRLEFQSSALFHDRNNTEYTSRSTPIYIGLVKPVSDFTFIGPKAMVDKPKTGVGFPYTLTNIGTVSEQYKFTVSMSSSNSAKFIFPPSISIDRNNDKVSDRGDVPLTGYTEQISPSGNINIIIYGLTSPDIKDGDTIEFKVNVAPKSNPDQNKDYTLTINISHDTAIIHLTASPETGSSVTLNENITYTMHLDELIKFDAIKRTHYIVDNIETSGIIIKLPKPEGTEFVARDGMVRTNIKDTKTVYSVQGFGKIDWMTNSEIPGFSDTAEPAIFIPKSDLLPEVTGEITYTVSVNADEIKAKGISQITNQVWVDKNHSYTKDKEDIYSNSVNHPISRFGFTFIGSDTINLFPGEEITFPYTLTNTGIHEDQYNISITAENPKQFQQSPILFHDMDNSKSLNEGDTPIGTETPTLRVNNKINLLIGGILSPHIQSGEIAHLKVIISSKTDPSIHKEYPLKIRVPSSRLTLSLNSLPENHQEVIPGKDIIYTLDIDNLSAFSNRKVTYNIAGTTQEGYIVELPIPRFTKLSKIFIPATTINNHKFIVRPLASSSGELSRWKPYSFWSATSYPPIETLGIFIPTEEFQPLKTGKVTYGVTINPDAIKAKGISQITNQVWVDKNHSYTKDKEDIYSNSVNHPISRFGFTFIGSDTINLFPGEEITFPYTLTNTGIHEDQYNISITAENPKQFQQSPILFHDMDNSKSLNEGDTPIGTETPTLRVNNKINLLIGGILSPHIQSGEIAHLKVIISSKTDPSIHKEYPLKIRVPSSRLTLSLNSLPENHQEVIPGKDIIYTLDIDNLSAFSNRKVTYNIAGTTQEGYIVELPIPRFTKLSKIFIPATTINNHKFIVRPLASSSGELSRWKPYSFWSATSYPPIETLGIFIPTEEFQPLKTGKVTYGVTINPDAINGIKILNEIEVGRRGTDQYTHSNIVSHNVKTSGFGITLVSDPVNHETLLPKGNIIYTVAPIEVANLYNIIKEHTINGTQKRGVILQAEIPQNTSLNHSVQALKNSPDTTLLLKENTPESSWKEYGGWYASETPPYNPKSIGLFIPESVIGSTIGLRYSYGLQVNADVTNNTLVSHQVYIDEDRGNADSYLSNIITHTVASKQETALHLVRPTLRNSAQISSPLEASQLEEAPLYRLSNSMGYELNKNGVYLQLNASVLNKNREEVEHYFVQLETTSGSGRLKVELAETSPNSSIFLSSAPVKLEENGSQAQALESQNHICSVNSKEDCTLSVTRNTFLKASFISTNPELNLRDQALIDPSGTVFNSVSFAPIEGMKVSVHMRNGTLAQAEEGTGASFVEQTTNAEGRFTVPELPPGEYYYRLEGSGDYLFPSQLKPEYFSGTNYQVTSVSYGKSTPEGFFTVEENTTAPAVDIPVDTNTAGDLGLIVEKSVNYTVAEISDLLTYTLKLSNKSALPTRNIVLKDTPPFGFRYIAGSTKIKNISSPSQTLSGIKPKRTKDGALVWTIPQVESNEVLEISYVMQVGASAGKGVQTNIAHAKGENAFEASLHSNTARAEVRISDTGLLSDRGFIIGSVWIDDNHDGLRQKTEKSVPGVRIWLEDGAWVETDPEGLYSIYGVKPGLHVARLDQTTLPEGLTPSGTENRFAGDAKSRFVDLTRGEMHRADFPVRCQDKRVCGQGSPLFAKLETILSQAKNADLLSRSLNSRGLLDQPLSNQKSTRYNISITKDGDISSGRIQTGQNIATESKQKEQKKGETGNLEKANSIDSTSSKREANIARKTKDAETEKLTHIESLMEATKRATRKQAKTGTWLWPEGDFVDGGRFMVIIPAEFKKPVLYINEKPVSEGNLGELVENQKTKAMIAAWYAVETPERHNLVEVKGFDKKGREKILASYTFIQPGEVKTIKLLPAKPSFAADGVSAAEVDVVLKDDTDITVQGLQILTAYLDRGQFIGKDLQPNQEGYQFAVKDGSAVLQIKAPDISSDVELRVFSSDRKQKARRKLSFYSPLRDMIAVGVLEIGGRRRVSSLNTALEATDIKDKFPQKMKVEGRGSVFLKGRIKGDHLLTLAYDSNKSGEDELFRDIDLKRYYPIYGDSSVKGYEAQSRSPLYVRLEKDGFSAMYGDYRVDSDGKQSLGSYRQTLTGAKVRLEKGPGTLEAFVARIKNQQQTELIRGNGTALLYQLQNTPIFPGSEVIIREERDKNTPGIVLKATTLTRYTDYTIDYTNGQLQFQQLIPSFDENDNPVYLRVNYETRKKIKAYTVVGARAQLENDIGRIWASVTKDQNPEKKRHLAAVGGELKLKNGRAWLEGGYTEHGDGKSGKAVQGGLELKGDSVELKTRYGWAEENFDNPSSPVSKGRTEIQGSLSKQLDPSTQVKLSGLSSRSHASDTARHSAGILISRRLDPWTLDAGLRWTGLENTGSSEDYMSVLAELSRKITLFKHQGKIGLEVEQNIDDWTRHRLSFSSEVNIANSTSVYAHHDFVNNLPDVTYAPGLTLNQNGTKQNRTRIGIKTGILPNTSVYGEWRVPQALDSRTGEAAFGIKSEWEVIPGLALSPHFETIKTVSKTKDEKLQDSWALSIALADRRFKDLRQSIRAETRHAKESTYYGLRGGIAKNFNKTFSGVIKADTRYIDHKGKGDEKRFSFTLGGARRPVYSGLDILSYYQFVYEDFSDDNKDRKVHIFSTHANSKISKQIALSLRGAIKWQKMERTSYESSSQLFDTRLAFDLTRNLDAELQAGLRLSNLGDSSEYSLGAGLSYWITKNTRMTLGYNVLGFEDRDLDYEGFNVKGFYWRLAFKFDEAFFEWLE